MPVTAEEVEAYKNINIANYPTTIPTLLLWIFVLLRMLFKKAKAKFFALIIICLLMIVS
jgi:hypothetical protein